MVYVTFKDKSIYSKMQYSSVHRLLYKNDTHVAIELELIDINSNWRWDMIFDHELKAIEDEIAVKVNVEHNKEVLASYSKYRKWQKRKLYTREEFELLFEQCDPW